MGPSDTATAPTSQRPLRADARRNYDRLIAAAREVLVGQGADVSLEEIARRAGVGIGTLYRRFPNRLALLEAVYREEVDELVGHSRALRDSEPPWEALASWLTRYVRYAATKRSLFQELAEAVGKDSDLITYSRRAIQDAAGSLVQAGQAAGVGRPEVVAADLLRLVGGCMLMPGADGDQQDRMLQIVLAGILA